MITVRRTLTVIIAVALFSAISAAFAFTQEQAPESEAPKEEAQSAEAAPESEMAPPPEECLLKKVENTALASWIRESPSVFAFAGILLLHTFGMSLVVGINAGLNLRVLGLAREIPMAPLNKFFPVLWTGFFVNALTGVLLLYADLSTKLINPDFWVKIVCITLAVITLQRLRRLVFSDPQIDSKPLPANAKMLAFASTIFWIGAVTAGRLMAYIGPLKSLEC